MTSLMTAIIVVLAIFVLIGPWVGLVRCWISQDIDNIGTFSACLMLCAIELFLGLFGYLLFFL